MDAEAGSYLRLGDSCTTQLKAQGPSRTCHESKEEEEDAAARVHGCHHNAIERIPNNFFTEMCSGPEAGSYLRLIDFVYHSTLGLRVIKKKKKIPQLVVTW